MYEIRKTNTSDGSANTNRFPYYDYYDRAVYQNVKNKYITLCSMPKCFINIGKVDITYDNILTVRMKVRTAEESVITMKLSTNHASQNTPLVSPITYS